MARTTKLSTKIAAAAKTNSKRIHITSRINGKWAVKKEGTFKAYRVVTTQKEAIALANSLVNKGQASKVIVHGRNGKIRM